MRFTRKSFKMTIDCDATAMIVHVILHTMCFLLALFGAVFKDKIISDQCNDDHIVNLIAKLRQIMNNDNLRQKLWTPIRQLHIHCTRILRT